MREQGLRGFFRGWAPTFVGYSAQGAFKYGLYEVFKKKYTDMAGPEYAAKYKTLIYLAGSATAEVFADVALCPMEAVKHWRIRGGWGAAAPPEGDISTKTL
jgi:solute carrier family 25 phosphate transporter 3